MMRRLLLLAGVALLPRVVNAHPIHTTYATLSTTGTTATLQVRAFADDYSAAVARFHGRAAPADSSVPSADSFRYLASRLSVTTNDGVAVSTVSCGVRRAEHLYWLCLRFVVVPGGLRVANRLLTELHDDQVNIVQIERGGTLLFTRTGGAQVLPL